jgi:3-phosphoglycerate kinase
MPISKCLTEPAGAFIRADLNVPIRDGHRRDTHPRFASGIDELKAGAAVMLTSIWSSREDLSEENSLAPTAKRLAELLGNRLN